MRTTTASVWTVQSKHHGEEGAEAMAMVGADWERLIAQLCPSQVAGGGGFMLALTEFLSSVNLYRKALGTP